MKLYDGIDRKWVEVRDITPPESNPGDEYPPIRSRANFDRIVEQERANLAREVQERAQQIERQLWDADWATTSDYTTTQTVKREHA